eukprot:3941404-Rhodomonas_salina.2
MPATDAGRRHTDIGYGAGAYGGGAAWFQSLGILDLAENSLVSSPIFLRGCRYSLSRMLLPGSAKRRMGSLLWCYALATQCPDSAAHSSGPRWARLAAYAAARECWYLCEGARSLLGGFDGASRDSPPDECLWSGRRSASVYSASASIYAGGPLIYVDSASICAGVAANCGRSRAIHGGIADKYGGEVGIVLGLEQNKGMTCMVLSPICLRMRYATPGTGVAYRAICLWRRYAMPSTDIADGTICLCASYAMTGTDIAYDATRIWLSTA